MALWNDQCVTFRDGEAIPNHDTVLSVVNDSRFGKSAEWAGLKLVHRLSVKVTSRSSERYKNSFESMHPRMECLKYRQLK